MVPNPLDLSDGGEHLQALGYEILLERRKVADLVLPTGRLLACDPLEAPETEPFEHRVEPGSYPVFAITANLRDGLRTAYAVVEFRATRAHRWEIAHLRGEEPARWNERHGFHVQSNVAALMDDRTAHHLLDVLHYGEDDELERAIQGEFRRGRRSGNRGVSVANIPVNPANGGNIVAFDADAGTYVTYFGFDGDDEVAMAVLDFEVLDYRFTPFGLMY